jgi:hypothetical protein
VDSLSQHIKLAIDEYYKSGKYFAPYFPVVQSSGTGKSRSLFEMGRELLSLYCCVRKKDSTGYPPRTHAPEDFKDWKQVDWMCFLVGLVYAAAEIWEERKFQKLDEWMEYHVMVNQSDWSDKINANVSRLRCDSANVNACKPHILILIK